ncbi:hypothetical protein NQZ68_019982 [Dissostichus eleginoides]|nr:hypothetical protein NQZ68_019982 [Dissostichus eleginoides]
MTRGGKKDGKEDQEGGASSSVEPGSTAESKTEGKLEELAGLGKMLVRAQATEDEQTKKASSIQECHWRSMQQQLSQIQQQVSMLREERRLRRQGKEGLRNRQKRKKKKRIMERQLLEELERQRQAELTAQKAREEEEKSKREELVKILEENNRKMKSELEQAAAEKLKQEQKWLEEMVQYQKELELQQCQKLLSTAVNTTSNLNKHLQRTHAKVKLIAKDPEPRCVLTLCGDIMAVASLLVPEVKRALWTDSRREPAAVCC